MKPCARLLFSFMTLLLSAGLLFLSVTEGLDTAITGISAAVLALSLLFFLLSLRHRFPDAPSPRMLRFLSLLSVMGPLLSVFGRIKLFADTRGPSLFAPLLLGEVPGDTETLVRLLLLMLLASLAVLPPYLVVTGATRRLHFDRADGGAGIGTTRMPSTDDYSERASALTALLPFALLGIFATHLFVLFVLLGVNLYYFFGVRRAALAAATTAVLAAPVAFLAFPTNGLYSAVTGLSVALDLFPVLLLLPILGVLLHGRPLTAIGLAVVLLPGTAVALVLAFLGHLLPEPEAPLDLLCDYALPALAIVAAIGLLFALFFSLRAFGRRRLFSSLLTLTLAFSACLFPVSFLLRGDARAFDGALLAPPGAPEIEYRLYEGSEFTCGGVRYAVSNKGLVALSVVGTQSTVTVAGYDGEAPIPDAARRYLTSANAKTVYAVASGFLDGNERIETLVFPEGVTLGFFERSAIRRCPNLKTLRLGHTPHREVTGLAATAASLSLPREAVLEVTDLSQLDAYATSLRPFAGRLVAGRDLTLYLTFKVEAEVPGRSCSLRSVSATLTVKGEPIAGKPFTYTFRADDLLLTRELTLLKKGDPIGRLGDTPLTVTYQVGGELRSFGSFKYLYYDFAAEGSFTADSPFALADTAHHRGEEADCTVSAAISLVYE